MIDKESPACRQIEADNIPEINLWRAVLDQAVKDAKWKKYISYYHDATGKLIKTTEKWKRSEEAVNYLLEDKVRFFNSSVFIAKITGRNMNNIRRMLAVLPEQYPPEEVFTVLTYWLWQTKKKSYKKVSSATIQRTRRKHEKKL